MVKSKKVLIAIPAVILLAIFFLPHISSASDGVNKYYTYTARNVITHNLGYSPLNYTATDGNGFLTTSEANARHPVNEEGIIKEFIVNVEDNTSMGAQTVSIHVNGSEVSTCGPTPAPSCFEHDRQPLKIIIPAGEKGIFDFGKATVGYHSVDQITFVLDSQAGRSGAISFVARIGVAAGQSTSSGSVGNPAVDTQVNGFLTFFASSQPPTPKPGTATIHVEQGTGQVLVTTGNGEVNVLSRAALFYYSADDVLNHKKGYSPITYHTSNPDGFFSEAESYSRIPLDSAGLMKHLKVAVSKNTENGPVTIKVRVNGAEVTNCGLGNDPATCSEHDKTPIGVTIPAGYMGVIDFGPVNININKNDQITYESDYSQATNGSISFEAVLAL